MGRWVLGAFTVSGLLAGPLALWVQSGATKPMGFGVALLIGGFMALCIGPLAALFFMIGRAAFTAPTVVPLAPGERAFASLKANHWRGWEARGGRCFVTSEGLHWVPHRFNFQRDTVFVPWHEFHAILDETPSLVVQHQRGEEVLVMSNPPRTADVLAQLASAQPVQRAVLGRSLPSARKEDDGLTELTFSVPVLAPPGRDGRRQRTTPGPVPETGHPCDP